jgi:hypothetical protein
MVTSGFANRWLLGHKSLKYVLLYVQLSETFFGDQGYVCKEAFTR